MNLNSPSDAINAVSQVLRTAHKSYAGAQFRLAFFNDGTNKHFLTGHVIFRDQHSTSRPQAEYKQGDHGKFIFVEYWCREQWEAVKLLSNLLSGQAEIDGHRVEGSFSRSEFSHRTYPTGRELWTGHELRSTKDQDAAWREFHISQGHMVRRGSSPYQGPDHAINDWIFNLDSWNPVGADLPNKNTIVTFLPDSTARILSADWQRPKLRLEVELKIPPDRVELQILHTDSRNPSQSVPLKPGEIEVDIPDDATSLSIFLLDESDTCISHIELNEHQTKFGKADPYAGRPIRGNTPLNGIDFAFIDPTGMNLQLAGISPAHGNNDRQFMEMAIEEARRSIPEDTRVHPKVGAIVVKNGSILSAAHRGETLQCHAEYIALEKKLTDESVAGSTVYTTLEPCTTRKHPKIPCAHRLIERKVKCVVIGMLDPNPDIRGKGWQLLREAGIETRVFDHDLMQQVEELNREFTRLHKTTPGLSSSKRDIGSLETAIKAALRKKEFDEVEEIINKNRDALYHLPPSAASALFNSKLVAALLESNSLLHLELLSDLKFVNSLSNRSGAIDVVMRELLRAHVSPLRSAVIAHYGGCENLEYTSVEQVLMEETFLNPKWYLETRADYPLVISAIEEINSGKLDSEYNNVGRAYETNQGISTRSQCPIYLAAKTIALAITAAIEQRAQGDFYVTDLLDIFRAVQERSKFTKEVWESHLSNWEFPTPYSYLLYEIVEDLCGLSCTAVQSATSDGEPRKAAVPDAIAKALALTWSFCVWNIADSERQVSPSFRESLIREYLNFVLKLGWAPSEVYHGPHGSGVEGLNTWRDLFATELRQRFVGDAGSRLDELRHAMQSLDRGKMYVFNGRNWLEQQLFGSQKL